MATRKQVHEFSLSDISEDEYWYNLGYDVGMRNAEDITNQVNPVFLKEYLEGVEDGEEEYHFDCEDDWYLEDEYEEDYLMY